METYKLYLSDIGLFTTMIFKSSSAADENIYSKLLSDKLPADLGYMYENAAAQIIAATDSENSSNGNKIICDKKT